MIRNEIWLLITLVLLPPPLFADGIDDKRPLLCAPEEVFECDDAEECKETEDEDVGLANFFEVEFDKKRIRAAGEEPDTYSDSSISRTEHVEDGILVQGTEFGMAWSLSVSKTTGRMVLAVAGIDHGFVVFGSCIQE